MTSTALSHENTRTNTHKNPAETLGYRIVDLCTQINLATYQLLILIAEFERHHYGEQQGFLSTANWLSYQCGIGLVAAGKGAVVLAALQQASDAGADRADALAMVAQSALCANGEEVANRETGAVGTRPSSAERYQIHVELDHHTQHIRNGPGITDKIIEHLSCDASIITHRSNAQGEPLNVGRKTRTIPPTIRRALQKRDQGCRFPGCTHQHFVDAHHIQHWAHGGETKLSNLVMLCSAHHKRVHESGFRIEVDVDATAQKPLQPRFFDPSGQQIRPIVRQAIQGQVIPLFTSVIASAESAEDSNEVQTNTSPLAPMNAIRCPDYQHINWVLTNFHPPGYGL
jgi:hypothetical protein